MDEIIVNGVKITRIDPLDLQNLLHEANQTWMEGMMQLIQQSLQEDMSNFNLGT
jgi:urease accessory protein UreF